MVGLLQKATDHLKQVLTRYRKAESTFRDAFSPQQQPLVDSLLFLTKFALLSLPFYALLNSGWDASLLRSINATIGSALLSIVGLETHSLGSFIYGEQLVLDVTRDSTGWKSITALTALILATPKYWKKKVLGILLGITILFAANILRITSMFYAVEVYAIDYEVLHTFFWRWGLTFVVVVVWGIWLYSENVSSYRLSWQR